MKLLYKYIYFFVTNVFDCIIDLVYMWKLYNYDWIWSLKLLIVKLNIIYFYFHFYFIFILFLKFKGSGIRVATKVSGSVAMTNSFLSILGFIQPKCLAAILQEKTQYSGDGFWERFLFVGNGGTYIDICIIYYWIYIWLWFTPFILWVYFALMLFFLKSYIRDIFISTKIVASQNILEYYIFMSQIFQAVCYHSNVPGRSPFIFIRKSINKIRRASSCSATKYGGVQKFDSLTVAELNAHVLNS